jgi:hypothetical protein
MKNRQNNGSKTKKRAHRTGGLAICMSQAVDCIFNYMTVFKFRRRKEGYTPPLIYKIWVTPENSNYLRRKPGEFKPGWAYLTPMQFDKWFTIIEDSKRT